MSVARIRFGAQQEWYFWSGGTGAPIVLLHGGWAGAAAHWSSIWEALATSYRIIAPELPRIGTPSRSGFRDYESYVGWLETLLDEQRISSAVVVGNSFGATLAYLLALGGAERCRALVMVDGFPPPELPAPIRALMRLPPLRARALAHMRRHIYGPEALQTAFQAEANAPEEVRRALDNPDERRIEHMLDIVLNSRRAPDRPRQPTLLIWGERDRLPKAELRVGRQLHTRLPGSRFEVVEDAGHMPQVEQPVRFLRILRSFIASLDD